MEVGEVFVPAEVGLLILEYLSSTSDFHKFSQVSRSCRNLLKNVRTLRIPQGLRLEFLNLFEKVMVQGPVVAHHDDERKVGISTYSKDLEKEVWDLSRRVSGDFSLYLSAYRGVSSWGSRASNLVADPDNLDNLLDLMIRVLMIRALEFPESSVHLIIKEGCEISWAGTRCTLHIPVSCKGRRPSERLGVLIKKLFQTIPISHIAYQGTTISSSNYNLIPFDSKSCHERDYNITQVIFGSAYPRVIPLVSIGVTTDSSLFHGDWKLWDRKVMKGIQHIEFLPSVGRGDEKSLLSCLGVLGYNNRKSILSITGDCYLVCTVDDNRWGTNSIIYDITSLISGFNPRIIWKILVRTCWDIPTSRPRLIPLEQLEHKIMQASLPSPPFREMCTNHPFNHFEFYTYEWRESRM